MISACSIESTHRSWPTATVAPSGEKAIADTVPATSMVDETTLCFLMPSTNRGPA
jgi:hypothetical protein